MKRFLTLILSVFAFYFAAFAQEPTTRWPYLFPEFKNGIVEIKSGTTRTYPLNIHLAHAQMHYLDSEGTIREATVSDVIGARVGEDYFLQVSGEMMRVVAKSEHGCLVEEVLADFAALNETGGAYGVSSQTSATRKLSSIETDSQINQNHMLLMQSRSEGASLDLIRSYYLVYPGAVVKATRRDVEKNIPAERKAEWKEWSKSHKIKWNQPDSLLPVLEFLNP